MTALEAQDWMVPLALTVAVFAGLLVILLSVRISWVKNLIAWTTIAYAFLGAIMILAPKWHSLTAKYDSKTGSTSFEFASLQDKLDEALKENISLRTQISSVQNLDRKNVAATDWLNAAKKVKMDVDWANFLPADNKAYKIKIPLDDPQTIEVLAAKLGKPSADVSFALKDSGLIFLKDLNPSDLKNVSAKDLWITPDSK